MSDVALDSEGNPLVNPFTGLAPVTEPTQGEINITRIEALNRKIKELTEERDRTEAEERDRTRKFPIDASEQDKYQYLEKKYSNALARKDKEGQIYYRGEINTLLRKELTNSERSARIDEEYRLAREGLSPVSQKVDLSPVSQKVDQPEEESHGVKIFLIIVYVFLIIGTIVMAALYFSYKEEWFLYIILGLLALLFILFIVLFYISFQNSK